MESPAFLQIQTQIDQLTFDEQLLLLERLIQFIRLRTATMFHADDPLLSMATDQELHREIGVIQQEFACADADGLDII